MRPVAWETGLTGLSGQPPDSNDIRPERYGSPSSNVIKLSENCHSEERSNVGIRQNPLEKRIAAPVCELARNDRGLN